MQPRISFTIGQLLKAISLAIMATYFYLHTIYPITSLPYSWIPLVMVISQHFVRPIAIVPVLHSLLGEVFPTEIRTLSVGIVQSVHFISGALVVKFYPDMKSSLELYGLLYFYAVIGFMNSIWGFLTIPDNRSKSLTEIERSYDPKLPLIQKE